MKKFIACIFIACACAFCFAADYKFPGFDCKDKTTLENMLAIAPNPGQKFNCVVLLAVHDKKFTSFKEMSDFIDKIDLSSTGMKPNNLTSIVPNIKKLIAWYQYPTFLKDAYTYSLSHPSAVDIRLITHPAVGLTPTEQYKALVVYATTRKNLKYTEVSRCVDDIIELAPVVNVTTQKEDLQKINRIYTPFVIKDKANWEPVLTKVRTVLATY